MINRYTLCLILALSLLTGCQGVDTTDNPEVDRSNEPPKDYSGPAATDDDIARFKEYVWDSLRASNRCGNCHGTDSDQLQFVRDDNVNFAYTAALTIVDTTTPKNSEIVTRVAAGHNCWEPSDLICAETITSYLELWLNPNDPLPGNNEVKLIAPPIQDPDGGKRLPADAALFSTTVWPLLTQYCASCHSEEGDFPQAPYIAQSDVNVAYDAIRTGRRIDLNNPADSRLVLRLSEEFHNCWNDCQSDSDEFIIAIQSFADGVPITELDSALVNSKALNLYDGIVASGGNRFDDHIIARYELKSGLGDTLYDTSGIEPALNLILSGTEGDDYQWVGGWGIEFFSTSARGNTATSAKLAERLKSSNAYTIEAWLVPANVTQEGPARIISYSANNSLRNFTLGQTLYNYNFAQRSSSTDTNGEPILSTADADEILQATQQHVAITFSSTEGRKIFVNGTLVASETATRGDSLNDWDENYTLLFGAEADGSSPWKGKLRMVAIHERALTADQIQQNIDAGVGERYFLLFSISHLIDTPDSYILLEVSQFDNYSYLFHSPRYVSLNETPGDIDFAVKGMRIGINSEESAVGQVYRNLDQQVVSSPMSLSSYGTIIPLQEGPNLDQFFLTFEQLGSHINVVLEPAPAQPAMPADSEPQPRLGLRTFAKINASMSILTDVPTTQSDVQATYEMVKQQLPSSSRIDGFLASHQVAISQLAIEYCNALIDDTSLRASYFTGFDFLADSTTAFDTTEKRDQLLDPLISRINGSNLATQPDPAVVKQELNNLIDRLTSCGINCSSDRTLAVAKGSCAALLSSAVMTVQ
ncbi:MAG: LamG domain-containing protein [Gammaproteobacteria bacterium]|nr:LamG domain-containing protein [Gammaproteobacteria bacterium]